VKLQRVLGFLDSTSSLIILSTATGENRFVLYFAFAYAISSNLTLFAYTHGRLFRGGDASPSIIEVGASMGLSPQNLWYL